ncbi:MAG: hypothetical protein GY950_26010, partial [bacterium]|nr:hypothetical protein [bacterium]
NCPLDPLELRDYLAGKIPYYMIPVHLIFMERFPMTPNGKIKWNDLPGPEMKPGEQYIPPGNKIEKELAAIWAEVLGIEKDCISAGDNFFDIGGHSLKATVLSFKIHQRLNVKISLTEIFRTPTLKEIARYIAGAVKEQSEPLEIAEEKEYYPLASAQERLYTLQQLAPDSTSYNLPTTVILEGDLLENKLAG